MWIKQNKRINLVCLFQLFRLEFILLSVDCSVVPNALQPRGLCSSPGSTVHGILQARIPEQVTIPSCKDLLNPGIKLGSPALQAG